MEPRPDGKLNGNDARMAERYGRDSDKEKSGKKSGKKSIGRIAGFELADKREQSDKDTQDRRDGKLVDALIDALRPKDETGERIADNDSDNDEEALALHIALPEEVGKTSPEENVAVTKRIVEADSHELSHELSEAKEDSHDEAKALVVATFLEKAADKLEEKPIDEKLISVSDTLDEAMYETAEDIGVSPAAMEKLDMPLPVELAAESVALTNLEPVEENQEETEDEDGSVTVTALAAPNVQVGPPTPNLAASVAAHGGGGRRGRGIPPPGGNAGGGGSAMQQQPGMAGGQNFRLSSANAMAPNLNASETHHNRAADVLLGALIAWLVARHHYLKKGRRQGQALAKQQLKPIEKSLEQQVKALHADVAIREERMRSLAAEQLQLQGEVARLQIVKVAETQARVSAEKREQALLRTPSDKTPWMATALGLTVVPSLAANPRAQPNTPIATEAPKMQPEQQVQPTIQEAVLPLSTTAPIEAPRAPVSQQETILPAEELLHAAARIEIAGTNAKVLYQQGRLKEKDLQVVVQEYIRGSSRYERILVDKLKPPAHSETHEQLAQAVAGRPYQSGGGSASAPTAAGGVPLFYPISPAASSPRQDTGSMMRAAENRIAQDKLEFKKSKGVSPVTVAGGVAALLAALAAAFLL